MQKTELKTDHCTITVDPNGNMRKPGEIDLCFHPHNSWGQTTVMIHEEDLDNIIKVIKQYKKVNWWELQKRKKNNEPRTA